MDFIPYKNNPFRRIYLILIVLSLLLAVFLFVANISLSGMNHGQQVILGIVLMIAALVFFIRYRQLPDNH